MALEMLAGAVGSAVEFQWSLLRYSATALALDLNAVGSPNLFWR